MGSFNLNCFASQQTIAPRDACVVLPVLEHCDSRAAFAHPQNKGIAIAMRPTGTGSVGPSLFWRPLGAVLHAVYDDYGRFTLADASQNGRDLLGFLQHLFTHSLVTQPGENPYHEASFNLREHLEGHYPELNTVLTQDRSSMEPPSAELIYDQCLKAFDYVEEAVTHQRVFAYDWAGTPCTVQFAVMHAEAYRYLERIGQSEQTYSGVNFEFGEFSKYCLGQGLKHYDKYKPAAGSATEKEDSNLCVSLAVSQVQDTLGLVAQLVGGSRRVAEHMALHHVFRKHVDGELSLEAAALALQPWLEWRYVYRGMDTLNITIHPMITAGQDYSNEIGQQYAEFVQAVSRVVTKQRNDEYQEDFQPYRFEPGLTLTLDFDTKGVLRFVLVAEAAAVTEERATRAEDACELGRLNKLLDDAVDSALNAGCLKIQDELGIPFGDVAGLYFSGVEHRNSLARSFGGYMLSERNMAAE